MTTIFRQFTSPQAISNRHSAWDSISGPSGLDWTTLVSEIDLPFQLRLMGFDLSVSDDSGVSYWLQAHPGAPPTAAMTHRGIFHGKSNWTPLDITIEEGGDLEVFVVAEDNGNPDPLIVMRMYWEHGIAI